MTARWFGLARTASGGRGLVGVVLAVSMWAGAEAALAKDSDHSADTVALVARVIPTVVSITTLRSLPPPNSNPMQASAVPNIAEADGSGFVVDPSGYIATNRHVVEGAYDIAVSFADGRTLHAKTVWASPVVDVAFLKVEAGRPLPAVTLATDQNLRLGQRVIAIGNPLGFGISVSSGVVSALNRNIKQSPYDAFIQTDAAINHGSSGGPLFDEGGEVVGMSTALYASVANGGSEGLGFAIPGADLTFLIDQLKRNGRIRSGWLGVHVQKVTPAMADALGFPGPYGVIVASVDEASPASRAGLRRGDIIGSLDGQTLDDVTTLNRAVCHKLGQTVPLDVWRDDRTITLQATITEAATATSSIETQASIVPPRFATTADYGFALGPLTEAARARYRLPPGLEGVLVEEVAPVGEAETSGLRPGDVLLSVQMTPVTSDAAFERMIADYAKSGRHHIIVLIQSSGGARWVTLPIRS